MEKEKNKKVFHIVHAVILLFMCVFSLIFASNIAKTQVSLFSEIAKLVPKEMAEVIKSMYEYDSLLNIIRISSSIGLIISIILFILPLKGLMYKDKGISIVLLFLSILFIDNFVSLVMGVIAIIFVGNSKSLKKEDSKLKKLDNLNFTFREELFGIIAVLIYFSQFIIFGFKVSNIVAIIIEVLFRLVMVLLLFMSFSNRYKRDFKAFKDNFSKYIKYCFKSWGIMILLVMVTGIIRMILSGNIDNTENQAMLEKLSFFYLIPMTVIWAPIVEEGLFRGILRRYIHNDKVFIAVSAISFGLLHTMFSEVGLFNILVNSLQYVAMGAVMAYIYVKTNNIFTNMTVHSIQNSFSMIIMILTKMM